LDDDAYRRYTLINLPHARTVAVRIQRTLEALAAFGESGNGHAAPLAEAMVSLLKQLEPFEEDPAAEQALAAADAIAVQARTLVDVIVACGKASDRLGQHVRNLFECLGLAEEGALLSLQCGEKPDSLLR
jgi:hypothetical protein